MMLLVRDLRPARVARLVGVVAPEEDVPVMVVEVTVGTLELLFEGEWKKVGRGCVSPTGRLRVANVTLARSSSMLFGIKAQ
jgi:hypothetical protein